ncbi:hypothetical protein D5086_026012 [Populus alba]|uniref:Uncharacterized protein n=1 Tax=Populus alba TaxID=43335 RepID=A0ACC4B0Q7_POPAL
MSLFVLLNTQTMTPAFQTEKESFSRPLNSRLVSASQLRARTRTMKSKGCRPRTSRKEKTVSLEGVMESRMKSFISLVGTAGQACFSAVKAGVSGLTKATEKQYASRNITASFQEFYPLVTVSFQEFYLI